MKRFGFLDKAVSYLESAGFEVRLFENVEPDPSVETVMKGAEMKTALSTFLSTLFGVDPTSIGGAIPGDSFYYFE